ncbi:MAG: hypothetical protein KJ725_07710 [Gammaproteobacteria bacterium]|uniref:hypothetical protein n=1 Tax=Methylotuvimicrobium sp. TaxID=2822413 RepID=UPI001DF94A63|nr:hypothetical protein [Gammaproteobacteria bacterium]
MKSLITVRLIWFDALSMIDKPMTMVGRPSGTGNGKRMSPATKIVPPTDREWFF